MTLPSILKTSLSIAILSSACFAVPVQAQEIIKIASQSDDLPSQFVASASFAEFAPKAQSSNARLDYEIWDEALQNVVLDLGPSTRQRASRPQTQVGTRMVKGHKSAYRLEGTRVTFAYINDEYKAGLIAYRKDLEWVASNNDLTTLSRDEQLAFWYNLHNVTLIEQIALNYPVDNPDRIKIKIDGKKYKMDEAKIITIRDRKLSLKDIREKIVYPNWPDPNVIYGFYRGNIGSPGLPRSAFRGDNLDYLLGRSADEFVNSLRGFNSTTRNRYVSKIYDEAKRFYFKNWEPDLQAHLLTHANESVRSEIMTDKPLKIDSYDINIGDLSGGRRLASSGLASSGDLSMSAETARLLAEVRRKQDFLRRNDMVKRNTGFVIIEDLVPEDKKGQ
ncbi:MAG: DUF547 domain-containing protein [Acidimicrobiales bacterium]|nr:DUF547 domain-containing protein [Hyphomonadaceae bacterium]RZV44565.1 MAG: DUF547 domain-containing protein [Acidimicrobiales bacterium]